MIKFSVIIPNYNHAVFLKQRIDSILAQTYSSFEIIILDDCSTDNSKEIIEQFRTDPKVSHVLYNNKNSGSPFRQWQKGVELAKGDWIWIAESDDYSDTIFLEKGNNLIHENPAAGLFYCDAYIDDLENDAKTFAPEKNHFFKTTKWSTDYFSTGTDEIDECLGIRCTINNASSVLMKRELLATCVGEAATYKFHGDWYCYLAILAKTGIVYSAQPMNTHRHKSGNIKANLPEDGKHKVECFRILSYLQNRFSLNRKKKLITQFILFNLNMGLMSGRKEWLKFFMLDKKLFLTVLLRILRNRFTNKKNVPA